MIIRYYFSTFHRILHIFLTLDASVSLYYYTSCNFHLQIQWQIHLLLRKSNLQGQNCDWGIMSTNFLRSKVQDPVLTHNCLIPSGPIQTPELKHIPKYSHRCIHIRKPSRKNCFTVIQH